MAEVLLVKGDQLLPQLLPLGGQKGVVGAGVPLTRPYHLPLTHKAPELGTGSDVPPLPQAQLNRNTQLEPSPLHGHVLLYDMSYGSGWAS